MSLCVRKCGRRALLAGGCSWPGAALSRRAPSCPHAADKPLLLPPAQRPAHACTEHSPPSLSSSSSSQGLQSPLPFLPHLHEPPACPVGQPDQLDHSCRQGDGTRCRVKRLRACRMLDICVRTACPLMHGHHPTHCQGRERERSGRQRVGCLQAGRCNQRLSETPVCVQRVWVCLRVSMRA